MPMNTTRMLHLGFFASTLAVMACSSDDEQKEPVRIGFAYPLDQDPGLQESYQLALKLVNDAGGVLGGRPLEFVVRDTQGEPEAITEAVEELVDDEKLELLIGTFRSGDMAILLETTVPARALVIAAGAGAESLKGAGDGYLLRFSPGGESQRVTLFEALQAAGHSKIGLVTNNTEGAATSLANGLEEDWISSCGHPSGCTVVRQDYVSSSPEAHGSDGSAELAAVLAEDVDAIYIGSSATETASRFAQAVASNPGQLIYTHNVSIDAQFELISAGTAALVRWSFQGPFTNEEATGYAERYRAAFGSSPQEHAFAGFDAVMALALGIEQAQGLDATEVAAAIRDLTGPGGASYKSFSEYSRAFDAIRAGEAIDLTGTSGDLDLDESGDAAVDGSIWRWDASGTVERAADD